MDYTEILRILEAAQGDPAQLALASVNLHLAARSQNEREKVRTALEAAAIPHWVDEKILARLLDPPLASEAGPLLNALQDAAFVEPFEARGTNAVNVQETARLALRQQLRRQAAERFRDLSLRAEGCFAGSEALSGRVEALYHLWSIRAEAAADRSRSLINEWKRERRYDELVLLGRMLRELWKTNSLPSTYLDALSSCLGEIRLIFAGLAEISKRALKELEEEPPPLIFICYAHADNQASSPSHRWVERLVLFLTPLVREGRFSLFSDHAIKSGEPWHARIQAALATAKAAILMISPNFLGSSYIAKSELSVLLCNAKNNGLRIFPLLISTCLYEEATFLYPNPECGPNELKLSSLQAANPPSETLDEMDEPASNRVFKTLARQLLEAINTP